MQAVLRMSSALVPVGAHASLTDLATAQRLSAPAGAGQVLIQALGVDVRYTIDGSTPTISLGFRLIADADPILLRVLGAPVQVIEETSGAEVQYQWIAD